MTYELVLQPFPPCGIPGLSLNALLARSGDGLKIVYRLTGPLRSISIPELSSRPERTNGLWEDTCFELFMAPVHAERYWEVNLSPAGHWNVYRFDAYRSGMCEEAAWQSLPFAVERREEGLSLSLEYDLSRIVSQGQRFDVGVSAVIRETSGLLSYWALCHRGSKPDFHRRDGFVVSL
ncbi:MAG: DOMON-like domain-containing protein [Syntrophobacteraceae bacterium]